MKICFDNVNFKSRSGPNMFGHKLAIALSLRGHVLTGPHEKPDVQLSFIQMTGRYAPVVQRLDGIWFNTDQDYIAQNAPIRETMKGASAVIFQSNFDQRLGEMYLGMHRNPHVIPNGTDIEAIGKIDPMSAPSLMNVERVWSCASAWRPHKRLNENVRYFQEHADEKDCLIIAGANPDFRVADPRIFYAGDLDYRALISLYRASDFFLHLAWLDHCPNVVVDARAAGAHIICSSSGGTREIAGKNSTIIEEDEWDMAPCQLYSPPEMDFSRKVTNNVESELDIMKTADAYAAVLRVANG